MTLDNTTFEKVRSLLRIPINSVTYCGAAGNGVMFQVGTKDGQNNLVSGVHLIISEDFRILQVARIDISWGRYIRNWPVVRERLPLHPAGATLKLYC